MQYGTGSARNQFIYYSRNEHSNRHERFIFLSRRAERKFPAAQLVRRAGDAHEFELSSHFHTLAVMEIRDVDLIYDLSCSLNSCEIELIAGEHANDPCRNTGC
jgi:hypothetical protein